jgi:hypothetical protein
MFAYMAGELVLFVAVIGLLFEACRKWFEADRLDTCADSNPGYNNRTRADTYRGLSGTLAVLAAIVTVILIIVGGIHWAFS